MRGLFWNCPRLARAIRSLRGAVQRFNLEILCVAKIKIQDAEDVVQRLGFHHFVVFFLLVENGGIIVVGRLGVSFDVTVCSRFFISIVITSDPPFRSWMLTFVHGPTNWNRKSHF